MTGRRRDEQFPRSLAVRGRPEGRHGAIAPDGPREVDDPKELSHTFFTNAAGNVTAGVWECSPCKEEIARYGVDELCTVLSGSVTVTGADGVAHTFGPGDSFVMPQDFKGTWHITETLRKFWMIVEPPKEA
ncbi:MAG: cupin domain-containing protein [Kiloniellales bacterium]|nr:cupin domain-containing protein [Kiloniellales bacterium]